jgi:hypothetical protein
MTMTNHIVRKSATPCSQKSLADFVATVRVYPGPRGEVITIIRQLLDETDAPIEWCDLARALARHDADCLMMPARILWSEYRKFQRVTSPPVTKIRRARYG